MNYDICNMDSVLKILNKTVVGEIEYGILKYEGGR